MSGTLDALPGSAQLAPERALLRAGCKIAEKYEVEGELGAGGMGIVVAARDELLDRRVAVKVLRSRLLAVPLASERFIREARAATRITSEHGVKVLEVGTLANGLPFMAMEYLDGCDLASLLRSSGPLPASRAVDFVMQALQAIAEAHTKGIIHRDIKPSNLFLTQRADGSPLVKVLDFGIAKTIEVDASSSNGITGSQDTRLGSPFYMSPEQFQDPRSVDHSADIWAIGVTLYELISGQLPFAGGSQGEVVSKILTETPGRLQGPHGDVPAALDRAVRKCLERSRAARFGNVFDLATELARFGSEDARLSASRIRGLAGRRSSSPDSPRGSGEPRSSEGEQAQPSDSPLASALAAEPAMDVSHTLMSPSSAGRPAKRARRWSRAWPVLLLAAAGSTLALVRLNRDRTASGNPVTRASALAPAISPPVADIGAAVADRGAAGAGITVVPAGSASAAPSATSAPSSSAAPPRQTRAERAPPARPHMEPARPSPPRRVVASAPASASSQPPPASDAELRRLIQSRE